MRCVSKTLIRGAVAAALALSVAGPAQAQSRTSGTAPLGSTEARPMIGLGVSIEPLAEAAGRSKTIELYVPVLVAPQFRLEPSLGILSNSPPAGGTSTRDFTLGLGLFFVQKAAAPIDLYAGGRVKLNFAHVETGPVGARVTTSGTDVILAAAVGGEYYFVPRFSLGLEGQLGFFSNSTASGDNSGAFTTGLAFLRVYFM
jgi:hypothetical protein